MTTPSFNNTDGLHEILAQLIAAVRAENHNARHWHPEDMIDHDSVEALVEKIVAEAVSMAQAELDYLMLGSYR